jgi:CubicO group peptidase (beta-lactamase class C family)
MLATASAGMPLWALGGLCFVGPSFASDGPVARVDAYITSQVQLHHIPALSLIVLREGKALRTHNYGIINVELNVPNTPGAAFMIGSLSKQPVSTLCYYRLTTAQGVADLTLFLTPDGKLADGLAQPE